MVRVHAALFPYSCMENMKKGEILFMSETKCGTMKWFSAKKGYVVRVFQTDGAHCAKSA